MSPLNLKIYKMPCNNSIENSLFTIRSLSFSGWVICLGLLLLGLGGANVRAESMADNPEVQLFISDMVKLHGFDETDLQQYFSKIGPNARVLKFISPPTHPAQRSWQRYRGRFLENTRINNGVRFWRDNGATLAKASVLYGVPEEIIVSIIGIETLYGRDTGSFNTFEALATLAFYYPQRAEYFRQELEQLLLMSRENRTSPVDYSGSFAGALGVPQFMPGSLRRYAVDFDGDSRIDLKNSTEDAIGSVARFLQQHGWQQGAPIAAPARISGAPDPLWIEAGIRPSLLAGDLLNRGVKADVAPNMKITLVDLVTPGKPTEYWLGFDNFYVITRYNRSSFYAMSVYQLAQEIRQRYMESLQVAPRPGA